MLQDIASGTSVDWVHATQNVPLAYTFEFRDSRNGNCLGEFYNLMVLNGINLKCIQFSFNHCSLLHRTIWFLTATKSNHPERLGNNWRIKGNAQRSTNSQIYLKLRNIFEMFEWITTFAKNIWYIFSYWSIWSIEQKTYRLWFIQVTYSPVGFTVKCLCLEF